MGSGTTYFLLPFLVGSDLQNPKKKCNRTVDFSFLFLCFQICFSPFRFVSPQIFLWFLSSSPSVQVAGGSQDERPRRGGVAAGLASGC
jgi:hypothetical protein